MESNDFDTDDNFDLLAGGDGNIDLITFEYDAPDGTVATGILASDLDLAPNNCSLTGHVTVG